MSIQLDLKKKEVYVYIGNENLKYVFIAPENASDQNIWDAVEALSALDNNTSREWVILPYGWEVKKL